MRKSVVRNQSPAKTESGDGWLDIEQIATVEISSEDPAFPIESAFRAGEQSFWRAAEPGEQRIRMFFDQPVSLRRIQLRFDEREHERTQEFTLAWSSTKSGPMNEIVRQQWNFSPNGSTVEVEDYAVNLKEVSVLELTIKPDLRRGGDAAATLTTWRVGESYPDPDSMNIAPSEQAHF